MRLYIDPGTGSMLFTILIGIIGTAIYAIRMFLIKFKFYLSGGKASVNDDKTAVTASKCVGIGISALTFSPSAGE